MSERDQAPKSNQQASRQSGPEGPRPDGAEAARQGTAGTDRDYDESQESKNQGHGHPREERQQDR